MTDKESEARKIIADLKKELKRHDEMFANQYAETDNLKKRVAKLERDLASLEAQINSATHN